MYRHLYSIILTLSIPVLMWHVARKYGREKRSPDIAARLGLQSPEVAPGAVWIHACSLGEAKVALALVAALEAQDPALQFVLTSTTPSGLAILQSSAHPVVVFPWDLPWIWGRWFKRLRPRAVVVIETELWPNMIHAANRSGVPVVLANGRLSARSAGAYRKISLVSRPMWAGLTRALMQFSDDALRAHALGTPMQAISEVGSIKLDQPPPVPDAALLQRLQVWKGACPVVCLMSGHPGEEELMFPLVVEGYRVLLVPRHPVRGSEIAVEAAKEAHSCAQVSGGVFDAQTEVLIGDTFGDMGTYLAVADVVIIGGSFADKGGQNPVEPAALAKALVAGPSMHNFARITEALIAHGGLIQVTPLTLSQGIAEALANCESMGHCAQDWVLANSGSTARQATAIRSILNPF